MEPPVTYALGGVTFECIGGYVGPSREDYFYLRKNPAMAARYVGLREALGPGARIVEVGIDQGASTVFLAFLFDQCRMAAFDIAPHSPAHLERFFLARPELADRVRTHWGVDQANAHALSSRIDSFMGSAPLDLVIDDASHMYEPSLATFEALFPRLRPGGIYVLEDWSWDFLLEEAILRSFRAGAAAQVAAPSHRHQEARTPVARLVLDLALVSASRPDIISDVTLHHSFATFRRGVAELDSSFSLSALRTRCRDLAFLEPDGDRDPSGRFRQIKSAFRRAVGRFREPRALSPRTP